MSTASTTTEIEYPDSDGEPIAENTLQFRCIHTLFGGLMALFRDRPDIFVASDLLWYPIEGNNSYRLAPDAMVVFGRPKGHRGSYMQWREEGIAPQVVFEILSPGNRAGEMENKRQFYERHGVEEYYLYDPDRLTQQGWLLLGDQLRPIAAMEDWESPRLGVKFEIGGEDLWIVGPDGRPFATYLDMVEESERAQRLANRERQRADAERLRAEQERGRAEQERLRADGEAIRAEQERGRAEREVREKETALNQAARLAAQLRALGIEPEA